VTLSQTIFLFHRFSVLFPAASNCQIHSIQTLKTRDRPALTHRVAFQLLFPWHKVKYLLSQTSLFFNIQTILTLTSDCPTSFILQPVVHWKPSSSFPSTPGFYRFWKIRVQADLIITHHPTSLSWSGFLKYKIFASNLWSLIVFKLWVCVNCNSLQEVLEIVW